MSSEDVSEPIFKNATLSQVVTGGTKKRLWKSTKQILATERSYQWPENAVICKFFNLYYKNNFYFILKKYTNIFRFINKCTTII